MSDQQWDCTDTGNKERFVRQWEGKLMFLRERRQWLSFDGRCWAPDHAIMSKAEETAKSIFIEAIESKNTTELGRWAVASQATNKLESMLKRASEPLGVSVKEFDQDPYLINCKNGVVDLRTGKLEAHDPSQRFLQITDVDYDPQAKCPTWLTFLADVHEGDSELISFLQLLYGYATTGLVRDHIFAILYGDGRNGKDTEADTIRQILGDYGATSEFAIFLEGSNNIARFREAIGNLKGKRMTLASEAPRNVVFNDTVIKHYSGGNRREGAVIHGKSFQYDPSDKLFLVTNYLPIVKDTTTAFWDRVAVVPFRKQYTGNKQDTGLRDKLRAEANGIFNWLLEGARRYLGGESVRNKPTAVLEANREYEYSHDDLKRFIADCLAKSPGAKIGRGATYERYCDWYKDAGADGEPCPSKYFKERMGKRGVPSKDTNLGGQFIGWTFKTASTSLRSANDNPAPQKPQSIQAVVKDQFGLPPEFYSPLEDEYAQPSRVQEKQVRPVSGAAAVMRLLD